MPKIGFKHSEESKEKNRQAHLGKVHSEETKKKISQSQIGKHNYSLEIRMKISNSRKGYKQTESHRLHNKLSHIGLLAGDKHPNWRGGTSSYQGGYVYELYKGKYQLQHRLVMERFLNRKLLKTEVVHHKDKNRKNNDISNLELWDRKEHQKMHVLEYWENIRCDTS